MSQVATIQKQKTETNLTCNSEKFIEINNYAKSNPEIKDEVIEANVLYNNGKFYYSSGESVGALISYSCATVLLNSILRKIPQNQQNVRKSIQTLMDSLLQVVQSLQQKVGSSKSSDKGDDNDKDWAKICTKIKPLVFKKGGSDCIFYDDVAGLKKEKNIIDSSLVFPLIYPNLYPKTSKGILIYGPPGTGKTYLVKAAVNELQKKDDSVGVLFFAPSPGDLKGKYVGETEKRIEEAFKCASDAACTYQADCPGKKKYISIVFMDEMDAIAPDRDKDTTGLAVNSVNTLLQMMDGIKSFPNVAVVAATNYPWNLDAAILRRFDTQLLINIPTEYDLKELLNIEVNRFIDLETDRSNFNFCGSMGKKSDDSTELSCELECVRNPIVERYRNYPYSEYDVEYFANNKAGGLVDGIIYKLAEAKFSNSDLSRLIKSASTNAGEMAVNQSLFYSPKLVGDFDHDRYISSLTGLKISIDGPIDPTTGKSKKILNVGKIMQLSIDILKAFVSGQNPANVIQLKPPDFVRIQYKGYYYYNTKCLLYKNNDSLIQHYTIKDIYIKGHPSTDGFNFDTWSTNTTGPDNYFKNIMGTTQAKLQTETSAYKFEEIEMIIAFDFTFKQNNNYSNKKTLLPVYRDLINYVFQPVYDQFGEIKTNLENAEKIGASVTSPTGEASQVEKQYTSNVDNSAQVASRVAAVKQQLSEPPIALKRSTSVVSPPSSPSSSPPRLQRRKSLGDEPDMRGGARFNFNPAEIQQIKTDEILKTTKDNHIILSESATKIITDPTFADNWNTKLNNKFQSVNDHNLDFYNFLLLYNLVSKFNPSAGPEDVESAVYATYSSSTDSQKPAEYDKYVKLRTIQLERERDKANAGKNIKLTTLTSYLEIIAHDKITLAENPENKDIGFKNYSLINGTTVTMFYFKNEGEDYGVFRITVKQYKSFINNADIYNSILLISSEFDSYFIDIPEDLFEILFKDVFSDIKITTTDPDELNKIWTPNSLDKRLMQLYINDAIQMYNLALDIYNTTTKREIEGLEFVRIEAELYKIEGYLYGYLLSLLKTADTTALTNLSFQLMHDNYNIRDKSKMTFLGVDIPADLSAKTLNVDQPLSETDFKTLGAEGVEKERLAEQAKATAAAATAAAATAASTLSQAQVAAQVPNLQAIVAQEIEDKKGWMAWYKRVSVALSEAMDEIGPIAGGSAKTFKNRKQHTHLSSSFRKNKRHSKSKSFKSKKHIHRKRTSSLRKKYISVGGQAMTPELEAFVKWCVTNKEKTDITDLAAIELGPIANKSVFVKTTFKFGDLVKQRKAGVFNDICAVSSGAISSIKDWWKTIGTNKAAPQDTDVDKTKYLEVLQEIKTKNQLLPICFNNIEAIGTLTNTANAKITDDSALFKTADDIQLQWKTLEGSVWMTTLLNIASLAAGVRTKKGTAFLNNWTASAFTVIVSGLAIGTGVAVIPAASALTLILTTNIINAITQNKEMKPEDIINDVAVQAIFNLLTEIRYLECESFTGTNANSVFMKELAAISKQIYTVFSSQSKSLNLPEPTAPLAAAPPAVNLLPVVKYKATGVISKDVKNKLVNLNIPMQSFYSAMNIVKSTYNKDTGPLLTQYFENRDLFMENYKKREQQQAKPK